MHLFRRMLLISSQPTLPQGQRLLCFEWLMYFPTNEVKLDYKVNIDCVVFSASQPSFLVTLRSKILLLNIVYFSADVSNDFRFHMAVSKKCSPFLAKNYIYF